MLIRNMCRLAISIFIVSSSPIHSAPVSSTVAIADISAGQKRAAVCFGCHGTNGIANIPGTPHLAGQQRAYLENAIHAYREGIKRQDPIMNSMAKPLSDADIANIAAYFSSLPR